MENYKKMSKPPKSALKQIRGGRLSGMTDINPQWRYEIMTEVYGPCGFGWRFDIERVWREEGTEGQVFAFAEIKLYVNIAEEMKADVPIYWSNAIPGIGGSMLIAKEKNGLHVSDEAYKMAITDALSTACKMLGVAADIYAGKWDGTKYKDGEIGPYEKKVEANTKSGNKISDYIDKVDKLESADAVIKWIELNRGAVKKDLTTAEASKLRRYCNQIIDIFNVEK